MRMSIVSSAQHNHWFANNNHALDRPPSFIKWIWKIFPPLQLQQKKQQQQNQSPIPLLPFSLLVTTDIMGEMKRALLKPTLCDYIKKEFG